MWTGSLLTAPRLQAYRLNGWVASVAFKRSTRMALYD